MQAVSFPNPGQLELIEIPRPRIAEPSDAIVLVTTSAISAWDIEKFKQGPSDKKFVPGGEFAGIVVELGSAVKLVELDDLVCNTQRIVNKEGKSEVFGTTALDGGHAEYVRVPNADSTLIKIPESTEERALMAGGTLGLGINATKMAIRVNLSSTYAVVGCDPIGMSALISLKNAGHSEQVIAVEDHAARRTLAEKFSGRTFSSSDDLPGSSSNVVIVGSTREFNHPNVIAHLAQSSGVVVFAEPEGPKRLGDKVIKFNESAAIVAAEWPTIEDARKIVTDMQIKRLDLTPLVSHVIPFDDAIEAYQAAAKPGPGVQKVLLKF
tara:strand:+ start:563 stop:1531 length:969 start_codon:yes stop_codon:yes gene_type:complete